MKKKIIGSLTILAFAAISAFHINFVTQEDGLSLISLSNIEALAENETTPPITIPCCPKEGSTCKVSIVDGNGTPATLTVENATNCS